VHREATSQHSRGGVSATGYVANPAKGDEHDDLIRMMIPHHQGAIDMALVQLKYGRNEKLRRLAQSIIVEQGQEIAYMRGLLDPPAEGHPASPQSHR